MRSRNDLPGSWVTSTTSWSERSLVPPVTAERSPPDSRITGADSPVIADSSTEPTPSMISPSAGMISPALTTTTSPCCSSGAGTSSIAPVVGAPVGDRRRPRRAQRVRLRLAAALGDRLGEVREQDGQPEPDRDHADEPELARTGRARARGRRSTVVITLPSSTMNITGFRTCWRGSSFGNESRIATSDELAREDACGLRAIYLPCSLSSARFSSRTLTPGSPKKPSERPSVLSSISCCDASRAAGARTAATRRRLEVGVGGRDVRVDARARGRDGVDGDVVDREARVVRALELEDRSACSSDVLGEIRVGRAEVREGRAAGVVGRRGRGRPRVEVARLRERLGGEAASRRPGRRP